MQLVAPISWPLLTLTLTLTPTLTYLRPYPNSCIITVACCFSLFQRCGLAVELGVVVSRGPRHTSDAIDGEGRTRSQAVWRGREGKAAYEDAPGAWDGQRGTEKCSIEQHGGKYFDEMFECEHWEEVDTE